MKRVLTQLKAEIDGNENSTIIEYQEIKNELKKLENERFEHWKKTNRLSEIYEGEQISLAMIQKAKIKREENIMKRLKQDDGKIIEEETQIRVQVRDYYRKIHKRKENLDIGGVFLQGFCVTNEVADHENELLCENITEQELKQALKETKSGKAPGKDGLGYQFYKLFYSEISETLLGAMNEMIKKGADKTQTLAVITLVPKKGDPEKLENWRPISLLPCDTRLVSKILTNRLKKIIGKILGETQYGGIKGRKIQHILRMLRDLFLEKEEELLKRELSWVLICIDLIKAYDSVEREILWILMKEKFSFCKEFINFFKNLYINATGQIVLNGEKTRPFPFEIGLRQGDPSSSYLFEIYLDPLIKYIEARITGIPIREAKVLKSAAYVDDTTFLANGSQDVLEVTRALRWYEQHYKLKIHKKKSNMLPLSDNEKWKKSLENFSWLPVVTSTKILGVNISTEGNMWQKAWSKKVAEIQYMLNGNEKNRSLTVFQRATYINMYCIPRLLYLALITPLPYSLATEIEKHIWRFVWHGKVEKLNKGMLYQPKDKGGNGVLDFRSACKNLLIRNTIDSLNGGNHSILTREWLIKALNEEDFPETKIPMYARNIFKVIQQAKETGLLEVEEKMKKREIGNLLKLTENEPIYHVKEKEPFINFETAFSNLHAFPMETRVREVMFMIIHRIMPYRDRIARFIRSENPRCHLCSEVVLDGLSHEFLECEKNENIFNFVFEIVRNLGVSIESEEDKKRIIKLDIREKMEDKKKNMVCFIVGNLCRYVWSRRKRKEKINIDIFKKFLDKEVDFLRISNRFEKYFEMNIY